MAEDQETKADRYRERGKRIGEKDGKEDEKQNTEANSGTWVSEIVRKRGYRSRKSNEEVGGGSERGKDDQNEE